MSRELHLFSLTSPGGFSQEKFAGNPHGKLAAALDSVVKLAKKSEDAKFDALLLADFVAGPVKSSEWKHRAPSYLDPVVISAAVADATSRLGILSTLSSSWDHPYTLARQLLSLDHLSNGRIAWNVVTNHSEDTAYTYGHDSLPTHAARYARAREAVEVVNALWDSFPDDADPEGVHATSFAGEYVRTRSVLGLPRSPQGRPPIVQAGQSEDGIDFAAQYADAVFVGRDTQELAKVDRDALITGAAGYGRTQPPLALSSLGFIIAETEEEAFALDKEVYDRQPVRSKLDFIQKYVEAGSWVIDPDNLDVPLPKFPEYTELRQSGLDYYLRVSKEREWTVRDFLFRTRGGQFFYFVGTPQSIADEIERWFVEGAADGFVLMPKGPRDQQLDLFIEQALPILRDRGLFRTEYSGPTLRDHLGLERPSNVHGSKVAVAAAT